MLLVVDVLSVVNSAVCPTELAGAVHLIVAPLAVILRSIRPLEGASAVLLALQGVSIKEGAIRPRLTAASLLLVLVPLTFVGCTFSVIVVADTVGFIVDPLPLEHVAVGKDKSAIPIRHIVLPEPLKLATVRPHLQAIAFFGLSRLVPLA